MSNLNELFGKGSIDTIGKAHRSAMDAAPKGSKERSFHTIARNRAVRIKHANAGTSTVNPNGTKTGVVPTKKDTVKYGKEDRQKMKSFKESLFETQEVSAETKKARQDTDNYLEKRHDEIGRRHRLGHSTDRIAKDMKLHPAIVSATTGSMQKEDIVSEGPKFILKHGVLVPAPPKGSQVFHGNLSTKKKPTKKTTKESIEEEIVKKGSSWYNNTHGTGPWKSKEDAAKKSKPHKSEDSYDKNDRAGIREGSLDEIAMSTKCDYKVAADKDFGKQAEKRFDPKSSPEEKATAIRKMKNRAEGSNRVRTQLASFKETLDLNEEHKVIASYTPDRKDHHFKGDRYEVHAHNVGHKSEWHAIVKTHQGGHSTKNEWGGHSPINVGSPKHVASKWKKLKDQYNNPNVRSFATEETNIDEVNHQGFTKKEGEWSKKIKKQGKEFDPSKGMIGRYDEETLDEISVKKVNNYIDRAENDISHRAHETPKNYSDDKTWRRKYKNRGKGLDNAWNKLSGGWGDKKAKVIASEAIDFAKLAKKVHTKAMAGWVKNNNKGFAELANKGKGIENGGCSKN